MNPKAIIGIPRKNINGIPFDTEISSVKFSFGPRIETLNQLMKQFDQMSKMMKMMQGGKGKQMMQMLQNMK